jgi:hypothetical protein
MSTQQIIKDLYMLQETANGNLEIGSNSVRKSEIRFWSQSHLTDPDEKMDWDAILSELQSWEKQGYIEILVDPRSCKDKDFCFAVLRPITAIPLPPDLIDTAASGSLRMTDIGNKKL